MYSALSSFPYAYLFFLLIVYIDVSMEVLFTNFHVQGNLWYVRPLYVFSHKNQFKSRARTGQIGV